ncbi:MAG: hypothetical protein LBK05_10250 [Treponema sp.]|nr:hypothetical protein [Treponema sp.]
MATGKKQRHSRIAWHPAFVQAFQLELEQYRDILEFKSEFQLTSEPLRIDLVVIRKLKDIPIEKNIAAIFRAENLVEYKSPGDHISVADFYKAYGCACLYASLEAVPVTELTLTFVESRLPKKLLKHFREERGYRIEERGGIYRVEGDIIPIQVIDNRGLSAGENMWLKGLCEDLEIGPAMDILKEGSKRVKKVPLEAYMQVVLNANAGIFLEAEKMGNGSLTFDDVLVKLGLTARWEEEGREKGREEVARNALAKGLPLDTIGEITGLDIETIKSFAEK